MSNSDPALVSCLRNKVDPLTLLTKQPSNCEHRLMSCPYEFYNVTVSFEMFIFTCSSDFMDVVNNSFSLK